ncbi:hypothetical protein GGD61_005007 [Bradyrhizobium sp. SBR1B]|nr:hypothetical protein [Bradyrhizobium sp. SBR1B]
MMASAWLVEAGIMVHISLGHAVAVSSTGLCHWRPGPTVTKRCRPIPAYSTAYALDLPYVAIPDAVTTKIRGFSRPGGLRVVPFRWAVASWVARCSATVRCLQPIGRGARLPFVKGCRLFLYRRVRTTRCHVVALSYRCV